PATTAAAAAGRAEAGGATTAAGGTAAGRRAGRAEAGRDDTTGSDRASRLAEGSGGAARRGHEARPGRRPRRAGTGLVMGARLLVLALLVARAAGAEVTVRATVDPSQIQVGESAALEVEIDGAQNAPVPELPAIDGLALQYIGPSTQVSIVNG